MASNGTGLAAEPEGPIRDPVTGLTPLQTHILDEVSTVLKGPSNASLTISKDDRGWIEVETFRPAPEYKALLKFIDDTQAEWTAKDSKKMAREWKLKATELHETIQDFADDFVLDGPIEAACQLLLNATDVGSSRLTIMMITKYATYLTLNKIVHLKVKAEEINERIDDGLKMPSNNARDAKVALVTDAIKDTIRKFDFFDKLHEQCISNYSLDDSLYFVRDMATTGGPSDDTLKKALQSALRYALSQSKARLNELRDILVDILGEKDNGSD
ncbi:hypothetical protein BKA80DRAFT_306580 [Phyllosticta citrichinensis]